MTKFPDPSAPVEPADLTHAVDAIQEARRLHGSIPAVRNLIDAATAMFNELTVLRGTVQAYREDLEDADAYEKLGERDLARSVRLEWPSIRAAVNPKVHTPAKAVAYLKARGWAKESDRHGGGFWQNEDLERSAFVPMLTHFVDWDKRMAELVRSLADANGVGEIAVLGEIAAAEPEASGA